MADCDVRKQELGGRNDTAAVGTRNQLLMEYGVEAQRDLFVDLRLLVRRIDVHDPVD